MAWPSNTDYIEAIQDPRASLLDEELRGGQVVCTPAGMPMLWSGNFADVYKLHCPATGNTWAVKCFTREVRGLQERYRRIAAHLDQAALPFTVDFQYLEQGIRIAGSWYPVLKMRWVEGLPLNQFVKEHLERPGNLKMLLDLWVKLATRLRDARMAHADLQHGNVLLVPLPGGQLALRLIDYDGMHIPTLAGSRSGELGHAAYQHPQRFRERIYSAEVDRFSHLVIYSAVRCLMAGRGELWRQFDNGDNLVLREADFVDPGSSDALRALWELRDPDARALAGHLILACLCPLEHTPLLDDVVADGHVRRLSQGEETTVNRLLLPMGLGASVPNVAGPPAGSPPPAAAFEASAGQAVPDGVGTPLAAGPPPLLRPPPRRRPSKLFPRVAARIRAADGWLLRVVGPDNTILHNFLRVLAVIAPMVVLGLGAWLALSLSGNLPSDSLHVRPVGPQTVELGKPLAVTVAVEDAKRWEGKLRYSLGADAPSGAKIDPTTGAFRWTPREPPGLGKYEVAVSVQGPNSQRGQTSLTIIVTRPLSREELLWPGLVPGNGTFPAVPKRRSPELVALLKLQSIPPQTIDVGKSLSVAVTVENADAWKGKLRYSLGANAPSGATIDPATGVFNWTPAQTAGPGKYEVVVSAQGPDGQRAQTTFTVTVTTAASLAPRETTVDLGNGIKLEMVLIPAGEFMMGSPDSDNDARSSEKPQHRVRITRPFYLGKYLVTQQQWQAVMGNNPSHFKDPNNPVESVNWDDCQQFLDKLNAKARPGGEMFRVPTEAQWEYACRAGSTTRYCFGDDESQLGEYAWYSQNSGNRTHPVGEKKANAFGLYDMHGNAWQWCSDWYGAEYYANSPADDPTGPDTGSFRVSRGGGWGRTAAFTRSAFRFSSGPGYRDHYRGFRVAQVPAD